MHETPDKDLQTRLTEWDIEKTKAETAKLQAEVRLAEAKARTAKIVMNGILTVIALVFAFIIAMAAL
ncbi:MULTISPECIES: hypothetical protein [unclassified Neisseria]|uniref:hypothetical protein n=1 Tax=unclassified Neisseria TaxID=2623750 RepID=UPI0026671EA2|nr:MULTISPECIES: hypothetical protein [unclassified Neisseria]MDO1508951.1 hypothetical protein [Neisseria sp. MVDL19-042950]MDO1515210.1 hypothetical protein [Neisseria sp. MVDL18-041461]MDO1562570.1 hypothetical protein [Neisseria sp. MVDL20-010259]